MFRIVAAAAPLLALAGCVSVGGGKRYPRAVVYPSYSEEWRSLQQAEEAGVLSKQERKVARKGVLEQRLNGRVVPQ